MSVFQFILPLSFLIFLLFGRSLGSFGHDHHHHKAHSFAHFHGPVHGHHQKVTWVDKHGHHHHDYVASPHYKFSYGVKDYHTKDFHGHKEHHDGHHVHGEYTVHEPGGNIRTVKYHVDKYGFHPIVHNSNGIDHHY